MRGRAGRGQRRPTWRKYQTDGPWRPRRPRRSWRRGGAGRGGLLTPALPCPALPCSCTTGHTARAGQQGGKQQQQRRAQGRRAGAGRAASRAGASIRRPSWPPPPPPAGSRGGHGVRCLVDAQPAGGAAPRGAWWCPCVLGGGALRSAGPAGGHATLAPHHVCPALIPGHHLAAIADALPGAYCAPRLCRNVGALFCASQGCGAWARCLAGPAVGRAHGLCAHGRTLTAPGLAISFPACCTCMFSVLFCTPLPCARVCAHVPAGVHVLSHGA